MHPEMYESGTESALRSLNLGARLPGKQQLCQTCRSCRVSTETRAFIRMSILSIQVAAAGEQDRRGPFYSKSHIWELMRGPWTVNSRQADESRSIITPKLHSFIAIWYLTTSKSIPHHCQLGVTVILHFYVWPASILPFTELCCICFHLSACRVKGL